MRKSVAAVVLAALTCTGVVDAAPAFAAAPTITSFTPTSGPAYTIVTVTGTGFTSPATVKFNGITGTSTVTSSTTLTARVPLAPTSGPITVTTAGGTVTSTTPFTVTPGVVLSRTSGPPTSAVTAYLSGLAAYEAVDVYVDTTDTALVSTTAAGTATVALTIPANAAPGTHWISVVGRKSGYSAQASFLVRTDWAQYGYGAGRTESNPYEGTLGATNVATLTRAWSAPTSVLANYAAQQATVAGGIVYLDTATGIAAFSEATGAKVWSQTVSGGVYTTPAVSAGLVLVGTGAGHLMAFTASTGAVRYDFGFSGQFISRPLAVAGTMGFLELDSTTSSTSASIIGFDVASGAQDWSFPLSSSCFGSAVAGGTLYTTCNDGHLRAITTSTGALLFDDPVAASRPESPPVVANGLVFSAGYDENNDGASAVFAYDAGTGATEWTQDVSLDVSPASPLVVDRGEVVLASTTTVGSTPEVAAFAAATGDPLWTRAVSTIEYLAPVAANGLLYVPGSATTVLDETTGAVVTRVRGTTFDVVTDAGLITASPAGTSLLRYTLPAPATTSAAPQVSRLQPDRALRPTPAAG